MTPENPSTRWYQLYIAAAEAGMDVEHAAYLAVAVQARTERGLSHDCDEYRALINHIADHLAECHHQPNHQTTTGGTTK